MKINKRVFLVVLDSFGIGEALDAAEFGDVGCNTLKSVAGADNFYTPNMKKLGFFNIDGVEGLEKEAFPLGSYARLREASRGKDTTIGHWEIAGIVSKSPLPTYPEGFPPEVIQEFEIQTGRKTLCNRPYSGTEVIKVYGEEHRKTGALIVYTSADSVFQIAAHEKVVPVEELYHYCEIARRILVGKHGVGRVIARPFEGTAPNFVRTSNRHDFSLLPPKVTMLDQLQQSGYDTYGIGKINDIFAGKGMAHSQRIQNNLDGCKKMIQMQTESFQGLCFVNLVDFDMTYGHRRDIRGYAGAATEFDQQLGVFINGMKPEDILMITADHGCDPGFFGTDHTREDVPLLIYGDSIKKGWSLGTRDSFADIAATVLDLFEIKQEIDGESFKEFIIK
ncbi:MAG: phosphopentomutase [Lachnospiraceae bacterium]